MAQVCLPDGHKVPCLSSLLVPKSRKWPYVSRIWCNWYGSRPRVRARLIAAALFVEGPTAHTRVFRSRAVQEGDQCGDQSLAHRSTGPERN